MLLPNVGFKQEYREQEYAHNLEKRKSIISRAEDLLGKNPSKALNELQYLHQLWKEAEPVAEEFVIALGNFSKKFQIKFTREKLNFFLK